MRYVAFVGLLVIFVWLFLWLDAWFPSARRFEVEYAKQSMAKARQYVGPRRILFHLGCVLFSYALWPIKSLVIALVLAAFLIKWGI